MTPEVWLAHTSINKQRAKRPDWSRDDLLALAYERFESLDLDKKQLSSLLTAFADTSTPKPLARVPEALMAETSHKERFAFRLVPNGQFEPSPNQWVSGSRGLIRRFSEPLAVFRFAVELFEANPRTGWQALLADFRAKHRYQKLTEVPEGTAPGVAETLRVRLKKAFENLKPYPDTNSIQKRYWGLEEGQALTHPDGRTATVKSVRVNLDSPPTLTLEVSP